ncbi:MAG: dUTP diphosphatase [Sulfurimonas sp.]|uniref:dUTP diphosphatase n=1 Tax=Sulfurimonas sp. TaxID=2022749 RepID=UPI002633E6FC|nr:dUTP diphosphatase [Sulfurimonas sp.]MDD2653254.1 dUTP diphosphatase [Sulfurimonas sp.]MDD3452132.1 dUTP diphosphatase [Sulfurimonas sp.]
MDKISLMLQLQADLNKATNGDKWTSGITKNNKVINWKRCIYMECAEMIDSFSWKHWKNIDKEANWANLQIEVVDVWHFIMSLAIELDAQHAQSGIGAIASSLADAKSFEKIIVKNSLFANENEIMEKIEAIMLESLLKNEFSLEKLVNDFFDLVVMSALDLETLYKLYVGKNILNQFRQDHGYKDGSYIKVWNGEEDNVVMQRVLEQNSDIAPAELYEELEKLYPAQSNS